MGIIDISTSEETKSSNYPEQCKLAVHWNNFAIKSNSIAKGEFNVFFINAEVLLKSSGNQIEVEGYKQITNYWAGPASIMIKQKQRHSEFTSIESTLGIRVNSFTISKRTVLKAIFEKLFGKSYQLDSNYSLYSYDNSVLKSIKNVWEATKIYRYSDYNLKISYNRNTGKLKMKFHKMLGRINELDNLMSDFKLLLIEIKKST